MPPRNTTLDCPTNEWVQITSSDVTAITFQIVDGDAVFVARSTNEPTSFNGANLFGFMEGLDNRTLSEFWLGGSGNRVWAYSSGGPASVMVSHA